LSGFPHSNFTIRLILQAVVANGRENRVIGGYDSLVAPNGVDLVYIDPPYFSRSASHGTNYMTFYHFFRRAIRLQELAGKDKVIHRENEENPGY